MPSKPAYLPSREETAAAVAAPWEWVNVWSQAGLCRLDPDREWYPDSACDQRKLTKICHGCPVRRQCLTWALETGEHAGVWGGLTERELRKTAALTPQGTRKLRPGLNVSCPWCTCRDLMMTTDHRVLCLRCGFNWPGLVPPRVEVA